MAEKVSSDGVSQFIATPHLKISRNTGVLNTGCHLLDMPNQMDVLRQQLKIAKRIIRENITTDGKLNTENAAKAILQYRNTISTLISSSSILFHEWLTAAHKHGKAFHKTPNGNYGI